MDSSKSPPLTPSDSNNPGSAAATPAAAGQNPAAADATPAANIAAAVERAQSPDTTLKQRTRTRNSRRAKWRRELKVIQRPSPLYTGNIMRLIEVSKVPPGDLGYPPSGEVVVDLTGDDDNSNNNATGAAAAGDKAIEHHTFYGIDAATSAETAKQQLQFHIRTTDIGQYPSPAVGLRLDISLLRDALGTRGPRHPKMLAGVNNTMRAMDWSRRPRTLENSLQDFWLRDPARNSPLLYGFPLMEEVAFYRVGNYYGTPSDCYWKAVAYHVYGGHRYAARVKAEHLEYFSWVLGMRSHPRYNQYTAWNSQFSATTVTNGDGSNSIATLLNLYQQLRIPDTWTSSRMFHITADLYNLYIVVYSLGALDATQRAALQATSAGQASPAGRARSPIRGAKDEIPSTSFVQYPRIYGSYNARHVFFLYVNDNHYQPMVPNEYFASEFQLPRPTFASTFGYGSLQQDEARAPKLSTDHPWRCDIDGVKKDVHDGPPPATPSYSRESIIAVMTGAALETDKDAGA